ncbi:MAG: hypothetical protein HQK56_15900 [Deltaproteobacteria bacterium]|nr:hypothetical protein [Deltaproteobacteria bacterium]
MSNLLGFLMNSRKEIQFIDSIDASFPIGDEEEAKKLVSTGAAISDNAALMIGLELMSGPLGQFINQRLSLLELLLLERPTHAVRVAAPIIENFIRSMPPSEDSIERLLEYCRENKGCYNALGILSMCSPELEKEARNILESWKISGMS